MKTVVLLLLVCCGTTLGILNGETPGRQDLLYMATLYYKNNIVGSGVVIDSMTILTKAPPLYLDAADYSITVGVSKLNPNNISPIKFDEFIRDPTGNLAIIKLPFQITDQCFVKPVALPITDVSSSTVGVVGGWGANTFDPKNPTPSNDLTSITQNVDNLSPGCDFLDGTFCAANSDPSKNTCYFDEGSPLVTNGNVLLGIVDQVGCTWTPNTIYINVFQFLNFINAYKEVSTPSKPSLPDLLKKPNKN